MNRPIDVLGVYLHLARASQQRRRPHVRDRLLVLAGAMAVELQLLSIAAFCRHCVLAHNPHHLLRRWPSVEAALADEEFRVFRRHLQRRYPWEKAERMLVALDIERGRERDAYFSDDEYAAALLGTTPEQIHETLRVARDERPHSD